MTTKTDGRRNRPKRLTGQNERIVTTIRLPRRLIAWLDAQPKSRSLTIEGALGSALPKAKTVLNLCEIDRLKAEETAMLAKSATNPAALLRYRAAHDRRRELEAEVGAALRRDYPEIGAEDATITLYKGNITDAPDEANKLAEVKIPAKEGEPECKPK